MTSFCSQTLGFMNRLNYHNHATQDFIKLQIPPICLFLCHLLLLSNKHLIDMNDAQQMDSDDVVGCSLLMFERRNPKCAGVN